MKSELTECQGTYPDGMGQNNILIGKVDSVEKKGK